MTEKDSSLPSISNRENWLYSVSKQHKTYRYIISSGRRAMTLLIKASKITTSLLVDISDLSKSLQSSLHSMAKYKKILFMYVDFMPKKKKIIQIKYMINEGISKVYQVWKSRLSLGLFKSDLISMKWALNLRLFNTWQNKTLNTSTLFFFQPDTLIKKDGKRQSFCQGSN